MTIITTIATGAWYFAKYTLTSISAVFAARFALPEPGPKSKHEAVPIIAVAASLLTPRLTKIGYIVSIRSTPRPEALGIKIFFVIVIFNNKTFLHKS